MKYIKQQYTKQTKSGFTDELSTVVTKMFKRRSG
jgi:hypothetical protein